MIESEQSDVAPSLVIPAAGDTLADRFTVGELACQGGMGRIHRAVDLTTGHAVAIKFIGSTNRSARARFLREGNILAELSHPSIVRYLAHGTTPSGLLYLVMEWLEGEDLSARLARGRLKQEEALAVVRRVSEGLAEAHVRGIVHRDIKPANVFLEREPKGSVKLLDFGVARLGDSINSVGTGRSLVGTVGYMAPEQVMCERDVDARADIFAVGCLFYECLTGNAPFVSAHPVGVLAKVLREEPRRPSELRSDLDPRVDALVSRMLAKSRDDRPRNAGAVLDELDGLAQQKPDVRSRSSYHPPISSRSEQRIVSVILGRASSSGARGADGTDEHILDRLSSKFSVEITPLQGGQLLLVLTGRGQANDRAAQAALCALDLMQQRPDLTLAVATGLADTSGAVPFGAAVDRAAALLGQETQTEPGIRVDDVTMGLIGLRFDVRRKSDAMVLVGARAHLDAPRALMGRPTPCVGRERELGMLDGILDECVADGVSRTVLVMGQPGIGKSRLAAEWLNRSRHAGIARTLFARADPGSAGSALSLMQQLLRDAVSLREADPEEAQLARLRQYVSRSSVELGEEHIEFLAELLGIRSAEEPGQMLRAARGNPEIMQERIRWALHGWLDAEASKQPVILVLEDLHWADAQSVAFLAGALREKPDRPMMVLGLARPETDRHFPALSEHAALQIRLQGLPARAAQQLVYAALEETPDEDVVARVIRTADGNPFYLEELLRRVAAGSTEWPDTLLLMAQSRIEELDAPARCVLRAASVFGERAWDVGVQELLGADLDAGPILLGLARSELLVENPGSRFAGTREYRFRHALLRDAAYAMMTDTDRRESHGLAGKWLEHNQEKDGRVLAEHFERAELADRARPWLVRAARAAIDAGDIEGTIELANRGVGMGATGVERGRLLLARSYAEAQRCDPDVDVARAALELLPTGSAPWWLALATLIFGSGMEGRAEEAAPYVSLAQDAPFSREPDMPFGQGLVTLVGGLVLLGKGDVAELIVERVAPAAESAEEPDPVFHAFVLSARAALVSVTAVRDKWHLERAFFDGQKAIEAFRRLGAVHGESVALYYFAAAAIHLGCYAEARDACQRSVELTQRAGSSINDGWPRLFWGRALLRLGMPDDALRVVSTLGSSPNRIVRHMLPVVVGEAHLRQGNFAAAAADAGPACAGVSPRLRRLAACVLARAQLSMGRPEEALSTVQAGLGGETSHGLETDIDLLTLRAEALHETGRRRAGFEAIVTATDFVMSIASQIDDPILKDSFLKNVEPCARAISLRAEWALEAG